MTTLKEYLKITCVSFSLVVLIQCLYEFFIGHDSEISIINVFLILFICLVVNGCLFIINNIDFKNDWTRDLSSIATIVTIVTTAQCAIFMNSFGLDLLLFNIFYLTIVYYGVVFILYSKEKKAAQTINEIIQQKKGNR